jgi:hypothetical protein
MAPRKHPAETPEAGPASDPFNRALLKSVLASVEDPTPAPPSLHEFPEPALRTAALEAWAAADQLLSIVGVWECIHDSGWTDEYRRWAVEVQDLTLRAVRSLRRCGAVISFLRRPPDEVINYLPADPAPGSAGDKGRLVAVQWELEEFLENLEADPRAALGVTATPARPGGTQGGVRRRRCHERDATFLRWRRGGVGLAAIRDRWNRENPEDKIGELESGRDTVKKGIAAALRDEK